MTVYAFDETIVSDLHKDARGTRPSSYWWEDWRLSSDEWKQTIWDNLCNELDAELLREKISKARAAGEMTKQIRKMYELGAEDEVQALTWIMEAEKFDESDLRYGADYFCYHFGLDYTEGKETFRIQEAINEMRSVVVR